MNRFNYLVQTFWEKTMVWRASSQCSHDSAPTGIGLALDASDSHAALQMHSFEQTLCFSIFYDLFGCVWLMSAQNLQSCSFWKCSISNERQRLLDITWCKYYVSFYWVCVCVFLVFTPSSNIVYKTNNLAPICAPMDRMLKMDMP